MRQVVIAVLALIIFWVAFTYRHVVLEALGYIPSFSGIIPLVFFFSVLNIAGGFLRWNVMIEKLGYRIDLWKKIRIYLAGLGALLSFVKFSDSIKVVLLKKEGVRLSHSMLIFGLERLVDTVFFSIFLLILFRKKTNILVALFFVLFLGTAVIKYRKKLYEVLEKWGKGEIVRDSMEAAIVGIKELYDFPTILKVAIFTLISYASQILCFSLLSGIPVLNSFEAVLVIGGATIIAAPTPGGIGFWEAAVSSYVARFVDPGKAVAAAMVYRLFFFWIPALVGDICLFSLR